MYTRTSVYGGAILALAVAAQTSAAITFNQNVTNEVIFGSGNLNGAFTADRASGVELGLRAKLRFDATNQPQNTFNSNGDGTYTFANLVAPGGFGFAPNSPTTPIWNFEWSVNSNFDGSSATNLDGFTYLLGMDFDPGATTNFLMFDPITPTTQTPLFDHAIGTNATLNGAGVNAGTPAAYLSLLANNNLAQNSWSYEFFNNAPFNTFDPTNVGVYDIFLAAFSGTTQVARVDMQIIIVPTPGSAALLGMGAIFAVRRRRTT